MTLQTQVLKYIHTYTHISIYVHTYQYIHICTNIKLFKHFKLTNGLIMDRMWIQLKCVVR